MSIQDDIDDYIAGQAEPKRADLRILDGIIRAIMPECTLWFLDGRNSENKVVSNPNIGYGSRTITYADGSTKVFYQIGVSANSTGISVYILGIEDRQLLVREFADDIGRASVTGYCIKFKKLEDIEIAVLESAIRAGLEATAA